MTEGGTGVGAQQMLDPEALIRAATEETGLSELGGDGFLEDFARCIRAVNAEANLSPTGAVFLQAHVHRLLVNRLRFEDDARHHPEMFDAPVDRPIIISGLPRTGTTKLQRMMSNDPGVHSLKFWRLLNPAPVPGGGPGEPDPRIEMARMYEKFGMELYPDLWVGHPMLADEPDEENFLQEMTFVAPSWPMYLRVPGLSSWLMSHSKAPLYDYTRRLVQYLQWQDKASAGRPLILKSPVHLGNLCVLLETFPGATVVHCHRDIHETIASQARLVESARRIYSDDIDLFELGDEVLRYWSGEWSKNIEQRGELDEGEQLLDVEFEDLRSDPISVIETIYAARGDQLSPEAIRRMEAWSTNNPQHRFGRHTYSPERYGHTKDAVEEAFAPYLERFGGKGKR